MFDQEIPLKPERPSSGDIVEYRPQDLFQNKKCLPLHRFGEGSFCGLCFPKDLHQKGVYAIIVIDQNRYVGESVDLSERFGPRGYGLIAPRNCFKGGQQTNCKVNKRLLQGFKTGSRVEVLFIENSIRKTLEKEFILKYRPDWNGLMIVASRAFHKIRAT